MSGLCKISFALLSIKFCPSYADLYFHSEKCMHMRLLEMSVREALGNICAIIGRVIGLESRHLLFNKYFLF